MGSAAPEGAPVLICAFASSHYPLAQVLERLEAAWPQATVLGASSSGEFNEAAEAPQSISAWALWGDFRVHSAMQAGLKDAPESVVEGLAAQLGQHYESHPHRVGVLLLDALSGRGEEATLLAATVFDGPTPARLVGGAAGDDLAMEATWVGVNGQVARDAMALVFLHSRSPFGIGVEHGHAASSAPIEVTRASGNVVYELDGRPAWDVWQERIAAMTGASDFDTLDGNALARFFFTYSASLASGTEIKVRAPLQRLEGGALSFACGIPEGSVIRVTDSTVQRQLDSARAAAVKARDQLGGRPCAGALVFDCVCRKLILGDGFTDAVRAISDTLDAPLAGFETYGEIALDVTDHSGFHNSTTVVLAIPR